GDVPELDHLGGPRLDLGEPVEGLVEREQAAGSDRSGAAGCSGSRSRRARWPPCLGPRLRRALSTRMRRMASAAAAKKWPRPSNAASGVAPTSRRYASWTRAVGWSV